MNAEKVAVIGGGSIGLGFALVFARAGIQVAIFEPDPNRRTAVMNELLERLLVLREFNLLDRRPEEVCKFVSVVDDLPTAVDGAMFIQECAPERLELKRQIFSECEAVANRDAILSSASSALTASSICGHLASADRCLVTHPGNPPYLIPVIEIVPSPVTSPAVVDRCMMLCRLVGLEPVLVHREIEGFVFNRLQGALLREAYCLVRDGVASVADIDRVVRDGLGLRWSVIGPFETVDLNTRGGIAAHAQKMGPAYARMGAERGQNDPWTDELVQQVATQRRNELPLDQWDRRIAWRDRELMKLLRYRKSEDS
jgi:3-hydroxyacyl-CoA dehydrogenase